MDYSNMPMQVVELPATTLVGISLSVTLIEPRIQELWQHFGTARKTIQHTVGTDLYAVEKYPDLDFFKAVNPHQPFTRWAAIEVSHTEHLPEGLQTLLLPAGQYAVFTYKGSSKEVPKAFQYIYTTWLSESSYNLDNRPHFAKMGEDYQVNDPNSQEEFWIPIQ